MTPIEIKAEFRSPAFAGILGGMVTAFKRLDEEINRGMTISHNEGVDTGRAEIMELLSKFEDAGDIFDELLRHDVTLLTDFMRVKSWETVESPTSGRGDDISWSSGNNPEEFDSDLPWVMEVYNLLDDKTQDAITIYFAERQ